MPKEELVEDIHFFKLIKAFLDDYLVWQKHYSENTQKAYRLSIVLLLDFIKETSNLEYDKIGFKTLTCATITDFLRWLETTRGCAPSTLNQRLMAIKSFAKYCSIVDPSRIAFQLEIRNVATKKLGKKPVRFLEDDSIKVLLDQPDCNTSIGRRDRTILLLMYDTAARCNEIAGLSVGDLYFGKKETVITLHGKGNKIRKLSVSPEIIPTIKNYIAEFHDNPKFDDALFYTEIHGMCNNISDDAIALFLSKYAEQGHTVDKHLPAHVTPHQIRHSRAMFLYRKGLPMVLLSEILGHSDLKTTTIYAWSDTEMKKNAIAKLPTPAVYASEQSNWGDKEQVIKRTFGLV
jgi:site-specific recombinase XerD